MTKKFQNNFHAIPGGKNKKPEDDKSWIRLLGKYLDLFYRTIFIVAFIGGIGWFLDKYLGTGPYLLIFGILFGTGVGLYYMMIYLDKINKSPNA